MRRDDTDDESHAVTPGTFDRDARWAAGLGSARTRIRHELVWRQLQPHVQDFPTDGVAVDVGCGQGTQVVQLARAGLTVIGIDPSDELLDRARGAVAAEPPDVQDRVTLIRGHLDPDIGLHVEESAPPPADIVICHGVLMYLPSLDAGISAIRPLIGPHGLLSILTRNQYGIAMRAGMERRWDAAIAGFDADRYTNRLGIQDVRAHRPDHVAELVERHGLTVQAWYGVRLFSDHWENAPPDNNFDALLNAELQAGSRDPYRHLTALTHTVARRP